MLGTFSNVSWHIQLKFFKLQTCYQLIEIQMVFHSNKNDTHNIQQIKTYNAHQTTEQNMIQDLKGQTGCKESKISGTFSQCTKSTARTIQWHYSIVLFRKIIVTFL